MHTLRTGRDALFHAHDAVLEFLLGDAQVLVGVCQVLDFLIELLLDLGQLLDAQRIQVDYISEEKKEDQNQLHERGRGYEHEVGGWMCVARMWFVHMLELTLVSLDSVGHGLRIVSKRQKVLAVLLLPRFQDVRQAMM